MNAEFLKRKENHTGKNRMKGWARQGTSVILALSGQRQNYCKFEGNLDYTASPCLGREKEGKQINSKCLPTKWPPDWSPEGSAVCSRGPRSPVGTQASSSCLGLKSHWGWF